MTVTRRGVLLVGALILLVGGVAYVRYAFLGRSLPFGDAFETKAEATVSSGATPEWAPEKPKVKAKIVDASERAELLSRAQVWLAPKIPVERASFADDPAAPRELPCRFRVTELSGTTPKFDCTLADGEVVRVKYGKTGEVPGEVASTRLLRALGFGADEVSYVATIRCYGCPAEPFSVMKAVAITQAEQFYKSLMLSYDKYESFTWAAVERKFDARPIETKDLAGWAMFELDQVDPARGGAPRAHVDAMRLLAVLLAHWDNKAENQRLVCLSQSDWKDGEHCKQPFLLLQDVGSTFGPSKVDLEHWQKAPIWADRRTCLASMKDLPYDGATFKDAHISEGGRQFLAGLLTKLADRQMTDLFTTSRFDDELGLMRRSSAIVDWVRVFKERVRQIAEGPPCPSTT